MAQKDFINLIEENIFIMFRLGERLKADSNSLFGYTRQQMSTLMRLYIGGRAKLKDIANREFTTTSNLCACFRRLENDGLVARVVDENDRRNTFYSVTRSGAKMAQKVLGKFRDGIAELFAGISATDEKKLTSAIITMNEILKKMEK